MSKGGNFESLIAKKLSLWITEGESDDVLEKNSGSGSKQTIRAKQNKDIRSSTGDIGIASGEGAEFCELFSIECKHYKSINLWSLITGAADGILTFWEQAKKNASLTGRHAILICRQNWRPILFVCLEEISDILTSLGVERRLHCEDLHIFRFDDVIKTSYENFIQKIRKLKDA